jgi:nitrate reductase gamma subunit
MKECGYREIADCIAQLDGMASGCLFVMSLVGVSLLIYSQNMKRYPNEKSRRDDWIAMALAAAMLIWTVFATFMRWHFDIDVGSLF